MTNELKTYLKFLDDFQKKNWRGEGPTPMEFLLKHGRAFPTGPATFKGRRMRAKDCYRNAANRALADRRLTYVEGYVHAIIPIEHAWLVDENGTVIDPTLRNDDGRIGGYFGVPIKTKYLTETLVRNKVYGVFGYWNYDRVLSDDPDEIVAEVKGVDE